jgi:hypothetical protein
MLPQCLQRPSWATFQPRQAKRRESPGYFFYPNESSHIFEKYWDCLSSLDQHPDFAGESPYCRYHMILSSHALSAMPGEDAFDTRPVADAKKSDVEISEDAGVSRLRPIQDGLDYWQENRSSAATGLGGAAPGSTRRIPTSPIMTMSRPWCAFTRVPLPGDL